MKYATWKIIFDTKNEGESTPEISIKNDNGFCEGAFYLNDETIVGYFDGVEISNYEKWQMDEISQEEFIAIAKSKNTKNELNADGILKYIKNEPLPL